jgi:ubiquinone/menaquinone biosynthesis C-methylase UbiE
VNHADHVRLLRDGVVGGGGTWADLGSGGGAFTLALADLLGSEGVIYSIDKDKRALAEQERAMQGRFPKMTVHYMNADFTRPLALPPLDGLVMANSLHFHRNKVKVLKQVQTYLKPGARFLLVEYNTDSGNVWVPHPFSFETWKRLAAQAGFTETRLLDAHPSRFLNEIYSAVSFYKGA